MHRKTQLNYVFLKVHGMKASKVALAKLSVEIVLKGLDR